MSTQSMLSITLRKVGDKLVYVHSGEEAKYRMFVDNLPEGQKVQIFFDSDKDNGTLTQLSKAHACMRVLANEIGDTEENVKKLMKKAAGLYNEKTDEYKSLADCSVSDLNLLIQAIIEKGDFLGINFR